MSAIKVGDLVVIVRLKQCGCGIPAIGKVFRVAYTGPSPTGTLRCNQCAVSYKVTSLATQAGIDHEKFGWDVSRLKRIPPLDELEREQIVREINA